MAELTKTPEVNEPDFGTRAKRFLSQNSVTLLFFFLCMGGVYVSELQPYFIANELLTRVTRNTFLVLALIIPVMAGMGLNFSIVVGAMAGQMAIIIVTNMGIGGMPGILLAFAFSAPIALLFGKLTGILLNKTTGQEMIASMIVGFFSNGLYQLLFLFMVGPIIPIAAKKMLLNSGIGLRNTIDLSKDLISEVPAKDYVGLKYAIDNAFGGNLKVSFFYLLMVVSLAAIAFFGYKLATKNKKHVDISGRNHDILNLVIFAILLLVSSLMMFAPDVFSRKMQVLSRLKIPLMTAFFVFLLAAFNLVITKTKLGQDFRAVGQNKHIAQVSGIQVNKVRELAIMLSTMFAAWGQIIFLQNMGILNTFGSHVQIATFAIAAILIGGASVSKATVGQAFLGVVLFHTLFIVSPAAGKNLFGDPQIGEFFRSFVSYGVIGVALGLHAWKKAMQKD